MGSERLSQDAKQAKIEELLAKHRKLAEARFGNSHDRMDRIRIPNLDVQVALDRFLQQEGRKDREKKEHTRQATDCYLISEDLLNRFGRLALQDVHDEDEMPTLVLIRSLPPVPLMRNGEQYAVCLSQEIDDSGVSKPVLIELKSERSTSSLVIATLEPGFIRDGEGAVTKSLQTIDVTNFLSFLKHSLSGDLTTPHGLKNPKGTHAK